MRRFAAPLRLADSPALRRKAAQPIPEDQDVEKAASPLSNLFQDLTKPLSLTLSPFVPLGERESAARKVYMAEYIFRWKS